MANNIPNNGTNTYVDVDTGDITVVNDDGSGHGTIFHIPGSVE